MVVIEPRAIHGEYGFARVWATQVIAGADRADSAIHVNASGGWHFGSNFAWVGSLVRSNAKIGRTAKQAHVRADVSRNQAAGRVRENIRVELARRTYGRHAWAPIVAGNGVAIIRVGREIVVIVPSVHRDR